MRAAWTRLLAVSFVFWCEGCVGDAPLYSGSWVEPAEPLRVEAGRFSPVSLEVRNEGTATWTSEEVYVLPMMLPPSWIGGRLKLARETKPGEVGSFGGTLSAGSAGAGQYSASWAVFVRGAQFGGELETPVEVTCSNGTSC